MIIGFRISVSEFLTVRRISCVGLRAETTAVTQATYCVCGDTSAYEWN